MHQGTATAASVVEPVQQRCHCIYVPSAYVRFVGYMTLCMQQETFSIIHLILTCDIAALLMPDAWIPGIKNPFEIPWVTLEVKNLHDLQYNLQCMFADMKRN